MVDTPSFNRLISCVEFLPLVSPETTQFLWPLQVHHIGETDYSSHLVQTSESTLMSVKRTCCQEDTVQCQHLDTNSHLSLLEKGYLHLVILTYHTPHWMSQTSTQFQNNRKLLLTFATQFCHSVFLKKVWLTSIQFGLNLRYF